MEKKESLNLIRAFLRAKGFSPDQLDEDNDHFQVMVDDSIIAFKIDKDLLRCSSLIYQFSNSPRPEILRAIEKEAGSEDRAEIRYESGNQTIYASREFSESIDEGRFLEACDSVLAAAKDWSSEILSRIADEVNLV